jgi:hopanoid biosynthesis associated RND transporter like protein HpnN
MQNLLGAIAAACGRHARFVCLAVLVLGLAGVLTIKSDLGVSTDTGTLFSASLPWKQRQNQLRDAFPQTKNILVAVIDAAIPEEADATAASLAAALRGDTVNFTSVKQPDASPFLRRNGLLYVGAGPLASLLDRTVDAQPFLGQLAADPSLKGLLGALSLIGQGVVRQHSDISAFEPALRGFHATLSAPGVPKPMSWETLLAGPVANLAGHYRFVLIKPKLDYGALQPGALATKAIRQAASGLEFVRDGTARVRITGPVALDDDEFASVAQGAVSGLLGSLVLVTLWLWIAVRSWRLILPILITLLLGLDLTAAFAALAVGTLNLVSVAFAVLFVGLAVDFAIQFTVRIREARTEHAVIVQALRAAGARSGAQILVASLSTAAGFLAFTPTSFAGVAQLGLIAGVGMLIAFVCTLTALPALIALCRPKPEAGEIGFVWARSVDGVLRRKRRTVLAASAMLAVLGFGLLPWLQFDSDPLHTKNQSSESVKTLNDLASDPLTNPYSIEMLEPSINDVGKLAAKLKALPTVDGTVSLDSLVPDDQTAKLAMIADAATLLTPTLAVTPAPAPDAAALRTAIGSAIPTLHKAADTLPADHPFRAVTDDLANLTSASDERLLAVSGALTRFLPMQLQMLKTVLQAGPVTRADIPPELASDWIAADGEAKLQVLPKRSVSQSSTGLHLFVGEVMGVAPNATGAAVAIVRSADTIVAAFRIAALGALTAITLILAVTLRRLLDTALVLAPLLMSSLLTVISAVLLPLPLNFANIIALPLLLGVGVSFNVYFVMNWRAGRTYPLASATARAVLFSALTTATAFGSLALSQHPGTASMGKLLLVSLACTLLTTLIFLPALLAAATFYRRGTVLGGKEGEESSFCEEKEAKRL